MGTDKKKMICGNCQKWEKTDESIKGMIMGRCSLDGRPFMHLNLGCTTLTETTYTDRGYKLDKIPKAKF